ncbi:MAG TPA: hydrolase [Methylorubrum populi]|uniref:Hydrolase n=1 Tax=Methylorubrum populi TaxID=223967 RepID=A0A921E028_9HYPH|nr:hydrolase [Methylorubrum populi]
MRQVFYLPGFDPREPETYWGLFRRESRITAQRRGMTIEVGEPVRSADGISLDWEVRSQSDGASTRLRYSLLRWDDIVRARFPRSNLRRLASLPGLWWRLWRSGYLKTFRREARRFHRVIVSVHQFYLAFVLLSLALAVAAVTLTPATALPILAKAALVPLLAYALLAAITRLTRGKPLYVTHLVDDTAFTHDHASGRERAMRERLGPWAERIRAAEGHASEIVVIGHSSSSFLALETLDRILAADPDFGRRGTPVTLVTIGSVIPWITLDPLAEDARAALARIGRETSIGWLDIRASWDWLSIHLRDPVSASRLPPAPRGRFAVMRVEIEDLIEPALVARRRWNLFRMHFQLLMSSRDPQAFDYIAFVAGPEPVHVGVERCRTGPFEAVDANLS